MTDDYRDDEDDDDEEQSSLPDFLTKSSFLQIT